MDELVVVGTAQCWQNCYTSLYSYASQVAKDLFKFSISPVCNDSEI